MKGAAAGLLISARTTRTCARLLRQGQLGGVVAAATQRARKLASACRRYSMFGANNAETYAWRV